MAKPLYHEATIYPTVVEGVLEIDDAGRIWRVATRVGDRWRGVARVNRCRRRRAENKTGRGYLQIRAMFSGIRYYALAHRLVWFHTFGPIPDGMQINHKNGRKADNRPDNLELVTCSENMLHATHVLKAHPRVLDQHGEKNHAMKLSDADVETIRREYAASGVTQQVLADRFGVTFQQISRVVRGDRRPLQGGPTGDYTSRRSLGGGSHT